MQYIFEYSPSGRAKCRAKNCGDKIVKDELRFGEEWENPYSEHGSGYAYRHWGCMTRPLLEKIKSGGGARNVPGFARLSVEDQHRVLTAVEEPARVPPPAATQRQAVPPSTPSTSQAGSVSTMASQKRKRDAQPDIIELSDTDSEEGPAKKKKTASTSKTQSTATSARNQPVASSSTNPGSSAGGSRPNALAALNALATGAAATQEQEPEDQVAEETDEVYTVINTNVVGTSYYTGLVGISEMVALLREPHNMYDRNAIRVVNVSGLQVGHIPRKVALKLAPLIDSNQISVEGMMTSSNLAGNYSRYGHLGIDVSVIGPSDPVRRQGLERQLAWATPGQRVFQAPPPAAASYNATPSTSGPTGSTSRVSQMTPEEAAKAAQLSSIMNNMAQLDDTTRRETLLNSLCGEDVLELPLHESPPSVESGLLNADLLKHQKQALLWCINAENPQLPTVATDKPVQFWKFEKAGNKNYYYNIATKTPQEAKPVLGRGGILGDDMGLGKTLTMLSLVLATRDEEASTGYSGATLIVAPLSVISNWSTQIEEHLTEDAGINYHLYYGPGRNVTAKFLKSRDIVITTYQLLSADLPSTKTVVAADGTNSVQVSSTKTGLFAVKWKRAVLDEGHTIRNPKTKTAAACFAIDAERRWVVSGTPIINNPSDLGALIRFLHICSPLDRPEYFTRLLSRPLGKRDLQSVDLLKALMSSCCLRRTKEMQDKNGKPLIPLPPVVINVVRVQLDEKSREIYDAVERESRELVHNFYANGGHRDDMPMGINVLSMLTRLRQIALDRNLIPGNYLEDLRAAIEANQYAPAAQHVHVNITPEERARLQEVLAQALKDSEECPVCFDPLTDPRITPCAHYFCLLCISEVITRQSQCPLVSAILSMMVAAHANLQDRRPLQVQELIEPAPAPAEEEEQVDIATPEPMGSGNQTPSAKVVQLIELLKMQPWDSKSLVFSQFTSFLDKIEVALNAAQYAVNDFAAPPLTLYRIPYVRFDGTMTAKKRKMVLELFSEPLQRGPTLLADSEDEDETEPGTDDEGYEEYWKKRKGKGKGKVNIRTVVRPDGQGKTTNPVVMLISLKSGSLGLNCTVANNVFLMDPWWQEAIESQAIDRVNRWGQKKDVFVYQMVADDTVEDKVLQIQERKRELIKQAFSGTKNVQTQREKKEARLHELIELFGKRNAE